MILLDTHIWLWWLLGDGNLKDTERHELDRLAEEKQIAVSWVSFWETEMLERKGRISLKPDIHSWMSIAASEDICRILPVDVKVVLAQRKLPASFNNDPADRLIACTSMLSGFPLATKDQNIVESEACEIWIA